jgi:hypothetical protein
VGRPAGVARPGSAATRWAPITCIVPLTWTARCSYFVTAAPSSPARLAVPMRDDPLGSVPAAGRGFSMCSSVVVRRSTRLYIGAWACPGLRERAIGLTVEKALTLGEREQAS